MLVANADCERHGNHGAQHAAPKALNELFVAGDEDDDLVAASRALALQLVQNGERALRQLLIGNRAFVFAFEINDLLIQTRTGVQKIDGGAGFEHYASTVSVIIEVFYYTGPYTRTLLPAASALLARLNPARRQRFEQRVDGAQRALDLAALRVLEIAMQAGGHDSFALADVIYPL